MNGRVWRSCCRENPGWCSRFDQLKKKFGRATLLFLRITKWFHLGKAGSSLDNMIRFVQSLPWLFIFCVQVRRHDFSSKFQRLYNSHLPDMIPLPPHARNEIWSLWCVWPIHTSNGTGFDETEIQSRNRLFLFVVPFPCFAKRLSWEFA